MSNYKITCKNCKNSDVVMITDRIIVWGKNENIISGRFRLDGQWGWQCGVCNTNDIMTKQEERQITNKQSPDPEEIKQILKKLIPDKPKFVMEKV